MKGNINVSVDNIFPLIKKFLYSDHEIFLRELVSNATDATLKLKHLTSIGEAKVAYGNPKIEIKVDKENNTLHIIDQGLGMTEQEVQKYINEIAFSGAQEFLDQYKDEAKNVGVIGHFGLGFYSAFMVSSKVEIITKSYKDDKAVHWQCDGSPNYIIDAHDKKERGTEIILHIDEESKNFLEDYKINELLSKYNKFMPIPIKFGTKTETVPSETPAEEPKEGEEKKEEETIEVDNIINNPNPAWTFAPSELKDEDYDSFYRELYPMQFEKPLFHIHLNVDHPFNLTGILYFPKINNDLSLQKEKIQLYQNQVFVTDNVEGIVPEFLTLLRGVIDSPDIPLNVSRSYLQADGNVKKISSYISKKVADKLNSLFKKDRASFEKKWNEIKVVIEYGVLSDDKFTEKANAFTLYPTVDGKYHTLDEYKEIIKDLHTDKDGKTVILYATDKEAQHSYISEAQSKGYQVLILDSPLTPHFIEKIESNNEKLSFARVDADHLDNLIKKEDTAISKLSDEEQESLKTILEEYIPKEKFTLQLEALDSDSLPFRITQPEFMRRMKEKQATGGGGMMGMGNFPDMYSLVVNTNNEHINKILKNDKKEEQETQINQLLDLAKLSQGLLKGEKLTDFIQRSYQLI